jgi:hypothetical protein
MKLISLIFLCSISSSFVYPQIYEIEEEEQNGRVNIRFILIQTLVALMSNSEFMGLSLSQRASLIRAIRLRMDNYIKKSSIQSQQNKRFRWQKNRFYSS